jgi:HPt (histidine-containing phosphotransfer) domain-containing protein
MTSEASTDAGVSAQAKSSLACAENLLEVYLRSSALDLPELDRALARGDVLKVASMAHRLRLSANQVGALELAEAADQIEMSYRQGMVEYLPSYVDSFQRAHRTIRTKQPVDQG